MTNTPAPNRPTTTASVPFPEGFLWGASTAAHQIEGNNTDCDWWVKE
ncbi:family 1 glycosylhydrolase, partial [Streptomyces sp. b94]